MKIEGVVISCYPFDLYLTRICVASVRFWYPDIPISLLKDRRHGDFSTAEIERFWNVSIYPTPHENLGWGFGKLEVLTGVPARRLLILDSDTAFIGKVIDYVEQFDEDLIVNKPPKEPFSPAEIDSHYFAQDNLRQFDPAFEFPGYVFNTGQLVATTGRLTMQDFDGLVDWQSRTVNYPDVFKMGEQGLLNYVALRKGQFEQLSIRREPFMLWPGADWRTKDIRLADLSRDSPHQQLIHWAGLAWGKPLKQMPRTDILLHFENLYYSRVPFGRWIRRWRGFSSLCNRAFLVPAKKAVKDGLSRLRRAGFRGAMNPTA